MLLFLKTKDILIFIDVAIEIKLLIKKMKKKSKKLANNKKYLN